MDGGSKFQRVKRKIKIFFKKSNSVVVKPCISRGGRNVFTISKNLTKEKKNENHREITVGYKSFKKNI